MTRQSHLSKEELCEVCDELLGQLRFASGFLRSEGFDKTPDILDQFAASIEQWAFPPASRFDVCNCDGPVDADRAARGGGA